MNALPPVVMAYFDLPKTDADKALAAIFLADARVHDERHDHRGIDAIASWWHESNLKTPFESKLLSVEEKGETITVAAEISGTFPGSPVTLEHQFKLRDGKIADLEIG